MKKIVVIILAAIMLESHFAQAETGVSRSVFTTAIENKEPVSDLQQIPTDNTRIYFFTELLGLSGHKIIHRWEYNGRKMAEITFEIGADRWRTWSSKNMLASWTGKWQVSVLDEGGNIIEQISFNYIAEPTAPAVAAPPVYPVSAEL